MKLKINELIVVVHCHFASHGCRRSDGTRTSRTEFPALVPLVRRRRTCQVTITFALDAAIEHYKKKGEHGEADGKETRTEPAKYIYILLRGSYSLLNCCSPHTIKRWSHEQLLISLADSLLLVREREREREGESLLAGMMWSIPTSAIMPSHRSCPPMWTGVWRPLLDFWPKIT